MERILNYRLAGKNSHDKPYLKKSEMHRDLLNERCGKCIKRSCDANKEITDDPYWTNAPKK